ncbi:MAG: glycosyltransferase family 4 protein [Planctomycetes bacterium]|jgi:glycosyltransferase involved in cell wall biosynthesis|nr:glycosyltransferase family 4 protein [Planctomycetota bacterium]
MRIGVNALSVVPGRTGGGETYLRNLLEAMVPRLGGSERLVLFCADPGASLLPPAGGAVDHRRLPALPAAVRVAAEHLLLPVLVRRARVDVLFCPGNAVSLLCGVPQVLALQSMHFRFVGGEMSAARRVYFRTVVPLSALRASRVLCMSEDLRGTLLAVCPRARGRTHVVHEGADLARFTPGEGGGGGYLLCVSSLNRFKRVDSVVRALGRLRREGFAAPSLRVVGRADPPDARRIEALTVSEGLAGRVTIEGPRPYGELPEIYRRAAALIYPSVVETFGLPPLEAMACGCPVVASDRTSVPEITGDAALLVDPDDPAILAAAIRRVLSDEGLRADLRARGFENARRFSWDRAAAETLAVLRRAMLGRTTVRR